MRTTGIIGVLLLVAVINWPTRSLAFVDTKASWQFNGGAAAAHKSGSLPTFIGQALDDQFASMTLADVNKPIFLTGTSNIFKGTAAVVGNLSASASIGHLQASLALDLHAQNEFAGVGLLVANAYVNEATATAMWTDTATVSIPLLPQGFPLKVSTKLDLTGAFQTRFPDAAASDCCGEGRTQVLAKFIDGFLFDFGSSQHTLPARDGDSDIDTDGLSYEFVNFFNGVPRPFGFELKVTARGSAKREGFVPPGSIVTHLQADYFNSLTWGGITGVFNAETGEPVENWTITSESGFDYSRPYEVPEPSSLLLIGLALCCSIGLRARR